MVEKIKTSHANSKHQEGWLLVNEISRRKNSNQGIFKEKGNENRLIKWYNLFNDLFGKKPVITHSDEEVKTIFDKIVIFH